MERGRHWKKEVTGQHTTGHKNSAKHGPRDNPDAKPRLEDRAQPAGKLLTCRPSRARFTPEMQERFLEELMVCEGNAKEACRRLQLNPGSVYWRAHSNAEFRKRYQEVRRSLVQSLEDEAYRRAYEGEKEPIYYRGSFVGHLTRRSDALLALLLKANFPNKYRDRTELVGPGGGPVQPTVVILPPKQVADGTVDDAAFEDVATGANGGNDDGGDGGSRSGLPDTQS